LIVASALLLASALRMPVLTTHQVWVHNTFSVFSGIQLLWNDGNVFLALLIFFFSIVFPIVKLAALLMIWVARLPEARRRAILNVLTALGKWSMLDVFVVAVVVVAVKLGIFSKANPEPGIYVFGASIFLSMVVSVEIDRLAGKKQP
jgi:paraquat-inducible protein A